MRWAEPNSRRIAAISREAIGVLPVGAIERHGFRPYYSLAGPPTARALECDRIATSGVREKLALASPEEGGAIFEIVVPAIKVLLTARWPNASGVRCGEAPTEQRSAQEIRSSANGADGRNVQ